MFAARSVASSRRSIIDFNSTGLCAGTIVMIHLSIIDPLGMPGRDFSSHDTSSLRGLCSTHLGEDYRHEACGERHEGTTSEGASSWDDSAMASISRMSETVAYSTDILSRLARLSVMEIPPAVAAPIASHNGLREPECEARCPQSPPRVPGLLTIAPQLQGSRYVAGSEG